MAKSKIPAALRAKCRKLGIALATDSGRPRSEKTLQRMCDAAQKRKTKKRKATKPKRRGAIKSRKLKAPKGQTSLDIPVDLEQRCKDAGVSLKTATGRPRSAKTLLKMCAAKKKKPRVKKTTTKKRRRKTIKSVKKRKVRAPKGKKTLTIPTALKTKCSKAGVALKTPTGRPRSVATLKRMCAPKKKAAPKRKKAAPKRRIVKKRRPAKKKAAPKRRVQRKKARCDDKSDFLRCGDNQICSATSGRCIKDLARNRKGKVMLMVGDRVIVGSPATIRKLHAVFPGARMQPAALSQLPALPKKARRRKPIPAIPKRRKKPLPKIPRRRSPVDLMGGMSPVLGMSPLIGDLPPPLPTEPRPPLRQSPLRSSADDVMSPLAFSRSSVSGSPLSFSGLSAEEIDMDAIEIPTRVSPRVSPVLPREPSISPSLVADPEDRVSALLSARSPQGGPDFRQVISELRRSPEVAQRRVSGPVSAGRARRSPEAARLSAPELDKVKQKFEECLSNI